MVKFAQGAAGSPRLFRNSVGTLAVQVIQMAANLGVFLILARTLGKERLGEYYILFALIMALQLVLEGGLGTLLTRRIAQNPGRWRATAAEAGVLFMGVALLSVGVFILLGIVVAASRHAAFEPLPFLAAGIACAGLQVQRYADGVLQAFDNFGCGNLARSLQCGIYVALVLAIVIMRQCDVDTAMAAFAIGQVVAAGWLMIGLRRHGMNFVGRRPRAWHWFRESVPLGVGDMLRGPNLNLDLLVLGVLQPAAVVGIYIVALRPAAPLLCLPRGLLTAAFPSLARLAVEDHARMEQAFAHYMRWLWLLCLPMMVILGVFAEPIIMMLVGPQYLDAVLPMRLVLGKTALSYLAIPQRFLFAAAHRQRIYAQLVLFVLFLETALLFVTIPSYGCLGAAVSCLIGEAVLALGGLFLCRKLNIFTAQWSTIVTPLFAAALLGWAAEPLRTTGGFYVFVTVPAVAGGYLLICFLAGLIHRDELGNLIGFLCQRRRAAAPEGCPAGVP